MPRLFLSEEEAQKEAIKLNKRLRRYIWRVVPFDEWAISLFTKGSVTSVKVWVIRKEKVGAN